jgi:DNA-directed RNA polymerase specialized sigma24 family protein
MDLIAKSQESLSPSELPLLTVELYSVIRQLPIDDQTLLIGKHIVGLDSNELAQILNCSSGAIRVKLHRANKRAFELFTSLGLHFEDFLM